MFKTLKSGLLTFVALLIFVSILAPVNAQAMIRDTTAEVEDGVLVVESGGGGFMG